MVPLAAARRAVTRVRRPALPAEERLAAFLAHELPRERQREPGGSHPAGPGCCTSGGASVSVTIVPGRHRTRNGTRNGRSKLFARSKHF